jgi:hypothetical protein
MDILATLGHDVEGIPVPGDEEHRGRTLKLLRQSTETPKVSQTATIMSKDQAALLAGHRLFPLVQAEKG